MATISHSLEKELIDLEQRYWQAIKERDVDTVIRLTDNPVIVTGASGVGKVDHQAFAGMMRAPVSYTIESFDIGTDVEVHQISDDVAVLAYKVHEELTVDGKPVVIDAADSSMWVRRNGQWLCALHTEAILGDRFGRDRLARRPPSA